MLSFEQDPLTADSSSQRLPECRLQPHPPTLCCPYSYPKCELTAASNVSTTHSLYSILTSNLRLVGLSIAELRRSQLDTGFLSQKGEETNCCTQSLHVLHRIRNGLFWDSVSGIRSHTGVTSKGWKVSHDGMGWSGCFSHLQSNYDFSHCAVIMT